MSLNASDVSLNDYQNIMNESSSNIKTYKTNYIKSIILDEKILRNTEQDFDDLSNILIHLEKLTKVSFGTNFDKWVVEDSTALDCAINKLLATSDFFRKQHKKESKQFKNYKSLSNTAFELSNRWENMYQIALKYKVRVKEAKEAYDFITNFIPKNKQVLKELA